jgi:hypothetical protein
MERIPSGSHDVKKIFQIRPPFVCETSRAKGKLQLVFDSISGGFQEKGRKRRDRLDVHVTQHGRRKSPPVIAVKR